MTDRPDKHVEKKDPLTNLGKSASKEQTLSDIYSLPEGAAYQKFLLKSSEEGMQLLNKWKDAVRKKGSSIQCKNMIATIKNLTDNDLIGHSNFLRVDRELYLGALGDDKDFRTNINDIEDDEVKGSN